MPQQQTEFNFNPGDIISWCGEKFKVLKNFGSSGVVQDLSGDEIGSFHWNFQGEVAELVTPAPPEPTVVRNHFEPLGLTEYCLFCAGHKDVHTGPNTYCPLKLD